MDKPSRGTLGSLGIGMIGIIGIIYLIEAFKLPLGRLSYPDRGFIPVIIGLALIAFSAIQFILEVFFPQLANEKSIDIGEEDNGKEAAAYPKKPVIITVALLMYCALFNTLGFVVATIPLTFVCLRVMEYKSWWVSLIVAVVITLVTYFLFVEWLGVYFPSGILG